MAKRSGLGKGLDSLISTEAGTVEPVQKPKKSVELIEEPQKQPENQEAMIKLRLIEPNREQPRKEFNEEKLAELAESIKEQVLKTSIDIFVNPDNYKYSDENIAEVATNAQEFYKERKPSKR